MGRAPLSGLYRLAAALLGAAVATAASAAPSERTSAAAAGVRITIATRIDSTGAETPVVRAQVPYRSLVFRREDGGGFRADVRVTAVARRDGERVGGGVAQAAVGARDYAATQADRDLACVVPLRLRESGRLVLDVEVSVTGTSRRWRERIAHTAGRGLQVPLYFADLEWNADAGTGPAALLGAAEDSLRVTVRFGRRPNVPAWPQGGLALLALAAPAGRGDKPLPRRLTLAETPVGGAPPPARLAWAVEELPLGRLTLSLWLESGEPGGPERLDCDPPRAFVNLAVRWRDDTAWRQHVGWLEGLFSGEERDALLRCPAARRREAWRALWAEAGARADTPPQELERAHLLRIVEADERFGPVGRGALTDRGRMWVRYGEPDSIEERGDDLAYEGRWEIWYYHAARVVLSFYDAHGLGDYRLVATGSL